MKNTIHLMIVLLMSGTIALAGGYQVRLQGQKQTGMGLMGTSLLMGSSTIFYNPAGMSFLTSKNHVSFGVSMIKSYGLFQDQFSEYQAAVKNPLSTPFYFYGSTQLSERLSLGLGVNTPYGSTTIWDADWKGRYLIQDIALKAYYIQPTLAYKLSQWLSVGVGFVVASGGVDMNKALPYSAQSQVNLKGNATSFGYNLGFFIKPTEKLSVGIDYRSKIEMSIENGDASFVVPAALSATILSENQFNASLPLPANLDVGLSYQLSEKWLLGAELNYVFWSDYKELEFRFQSQGDLLNSVSPRAYKNSLLYRVGAQYRMNDNWCFRTGAYWDNAPTNKRYFSPETVSLNSLGITTGITYAPGRHWELDVSFLFLEGVESDMNYSPEHFAGTYKTRSYIPGVGVSYKF